MFPSKYQIALNRSDLSHWVVHFIQATQGSLAPYPEAQSILNSILNEGRIRASNQEWVAHYWPEGAACLYDVPPAFWSELLNTNPNGRLPFGIVCDKQAIWSLGGRPVIYTDQKNPSYWPEEERFRLVGTNLSLGWQFVDWMHEREWRVRGHLWLRQPQLNYTWWWPLVPNDEYMNALFYQYPTIHYVYVMSRPGWVLRHGLLLNTLPPQSQGD